MSFIKFELSDKDNGHCVYSQTFTEGTYHGDVSFKRDALVDTFKRFLESVGYVFPKDGDWDGEDFFGDDLPAASNSMYDTKVYTTGFDPN